METYKPSVGSKTVSRSIAIALAVICVLLVVSAIGIYMWQSSQVAQLNTDKTNMQSQITSLQQGYHLIDPTSQQVGTFISTETNIMLNTGDVFNMTAKFVNDAEAQGYRCGTALIQYPNGTYSVAVFSTTDEGLMFIDVMPPINTVSIIVGQHYSAINGFANPTYDDTIMNYTIAW
jgi:hypothetical protein